MDMKVDIEKLKFPDYFPEQCPPIDAKFSEIDVYRICANSTLSKIDFRSFYEQDPEKYKNMILAYGISVFLCLEDCESARRKSPNLRRKHFCAHGITYKWTGKIKHTPNKSNPKHFTWWLFQGVEPHTYFKVCSLEAGGNNA